MQDRVKLAIFKSQILDCMKDDKYVDQLFHDMSNWFSGNALDSTYCDKMRIRYAIPADSAGNSKFFTI